jgi:hypothetical protein
MIRSITFLHFDFFIAVLSFFRTSVDFFSRECRLYFNRQTEEHTKKDCNCHGASLYSLNLFSLMINNPKFILTVWSCSYIRILSSCLKILTVGAHFDHHDCWISYQQSFSFPPFSLHRQSLNVYAKETLSLVVSLRKFSFT